MPTLNEIAKKCRPVVTQDYSPGDSVLFEKLYNSYAHMRGEERNFLYYRNLAQERAQRFGNGFGNGVYKDRCQHLWSWYKEAYVNEPSEMKKSGLSRAVNNQHIHGDASYRFDEPITENLFFSYLIDGKPLNTGDARDFIFHTAVAFKLDPTALDEILVKYGFHPMHEKNIHHMAIYAVLNDIKSGNLPAETNPFLAVREFFKKAREIVASEGIRELQKAEESYPKMGNMEFEAFATGSTRVIHDYIAEQKNMTREKVLSFIRNHPEVYGMRHDRLLAEHKRMVDLFSELYKQRHTKGRPPGAEDRYWLFYFLNDFCKKIERKHFNDEIMGHILKNDRHPTREIMIVLWLYSFCFLSLPTVRTVDGNGIGRSFKNLIPFSRSGKEHQEHPFQTYVDTKDPKDPGELRVYDYLSDSKIPSSPFFKFPKYLSDSASGSFEGSRLIDFINRKLLSYSWRVLDERLPFDGIIKPLDNLSIRWSGSKITSAYYGEERITDVNSLVIDNVPVPLVVITKFLDCTKGTDDGYLPLQCDCYEQV